MTDDLQKLLGRSLPSIKFGAWIVADVHGDINGRTRLVSGDMKRERWIWTRELVSIVEELDTINSTSGHAPVRDVQNTK